MVIQRIVRYFTDSILQFLQIFYSKNLFFRMRIDNNKITKTKIFFHHFAKILRKCFGIFIDKRCIDFGSIFFIFTFRRSINNGNALVLATNPFAQFFSCQFIFYPIPIETHVGNNPKHIVSVLLVKIHCFLIISCQKYLGPASHPQHALVFVECFFRKFFRFIQYKLI